MDLSSFQADVTTFVLSITVALLIGVSVTYLLLQRRVEALRQTNEQLHIDTETLRVQLEAEKTSFKARLKSIQEARQDLGRHFAALSGKALRLNNQAFLHLANEKLGQLHLRAESALDQRTGAMESLVQPLEAALNKTEQELKRLEQLRQQAYGALDQHLRSMADAQQALQNETQNLVKALRRPEVRGRWGELTLRRVVELAGMVEHSDFQEQPQTQGDERLRPDLIVHMPNSRSVIVDAKTPLDAYLTSLESNDHEQTKQHLNRHAKQMRERVRELAGKKYWSQFTNTPEFVVLFVPGDQFLSAAAEVDLKLIEDALAQKVIIATPTSLVALLRAIAFGWQQQQLSEHAENIRDLGEQLFKRVATFTEHLGKTGKSLNASVESYNRAVGSLERQVLPALRRFPEMGIRSNKDLGELNPIDLQARNPSRNDD